jgi:putative peptidoglycan lipid II flippase
MPNAVTDGQAEGALAPGTDGPRGERLARSAGILGLGNSASRVIGLAREAVISGVIGPSGELDAFRLAARVPTMIYDLLVGGMLSAALVPVFSKYARSERQDELARVASVVLSILAGVMGVLVLLVIALARPLAGVLSDFADPALENVLANCLRFISPAIFFFGLTGGVTGLLYALRRFNYTALSGAVFNLGIVIAAPLLAPRIGVYALPIGIVLGSILQLAVCAPGLRDLRLRVSAAWDHPAVRRIARLYIPIALGLIVTQFQIIVDGRWASASGEQSVSWMGFATTLIQLPLGLVPVAVSLAALPSLSRFAADGDWQGFRRVFARGLRLVVVLLLPAAVVLWVLSGPLITLLFQHGNFAAEDTVMTARALHFYLLGLPFAGIDFLLNYTFYARQNTRLPATVGVISIGFYFAVALLLKEPLGFLGLVLADSAKQAGHAAIMLALIVRSEGRLHNHGVLSTLGRVATAALAMGLAIWAVSIGLGRVEIFAAPKLAALVQVIVAGGAGAVLYVALLRALRVPEAAGMIDTIGRRLARRRA